MRKKVIALLSALTIMAMGTMTVFASPEVGKTETPVSTQTATTTVAATSAPEDYAKATTASEGYTVAAVTKTTVDSAAVAVQNLLLNDIAKTGASLGTDTLKAAATDSSKKVTATVLTVVEVTADTATKTADGAYEVTLNVAGVKAGDAIAVLHYNGTAWETIVPSKVADGAVTFKTSSLSPISVVKLDVAAVAESPKTGEAAPIAVAIVLVGLAGVAVCGKKVFA